MTSSPHFRRRARLSGTVVLAATVALVMAVTGGEANASHMSCGDTITADTTLDSDLINCPNNGIVIGADDVTLDLNGHLIDGDGSEFAGCDPNTAVCDSGVVDDGHDGVTVMHGSVREFGVGVLLGTTTAGRVHQNRVLGVSSTGNQFVGLGIFSSVRSVVRDSSGNGSLEEDGVGMALGDSRHVRILDNTFRGNARGIVTSDSAHNLINGNLFSHSDDEAILMEGGAGFQVRRNRFVRNGAGITLGPGNRNVITHNRVSRGRDGIRIEKGHGNLVAHNVVVRHRRAGIRLGIKHPFLGGAHNVVRDNLVKDSRVDGFVVNKKDHHSLLKRNIAKGAGDDGFDVASRSAKLTSNRALRNADLGIEAAGGVIDAGGNRASGNGDGRQCVNVTCH
jgi:parallel beta-helix repeat protein